MARPSKMHLHKGQYRTRIAGVEHYLGADEAAARRAFHRLLAKAVPAVDAVAKPEFMGDVIRQWQALHPSPKTALKLRPFNEFAGAVHVDDIGRDFLTRFLLTLRAATYKPGAGRGKGPERGYAPETIRDFIAVASSVLTFGHDEGWLATKPRKVDLPAGRVKDRDMSPAAVEAAFAQLNPRVQRAFRFQVAVGCRPGEVAALKWSHIRRDLGVAILPDHKTAGATGEPRVFGLTPAALEVLDELTPGPADSPIFTNRNGKRYGNKALHAHAKRVGFRPNQLRHTWAQTAVNSGVDLDTVAAQMGHTSTKMTRRYARIRAARLAAVASTFRVVPAPAPAAAEAAA